MSLEPIGHGDLVAERRALAERTTNVFATPEFHETWWRHFGGGRELRLAAVRDGDRLAGVVPAYVWHRRPATALRFLGHGCGDELGPVAEADDRELVAAAFRRAYGVPAFVEHVRPEWRTALGGSVVLEEECPVIHLSSFDGWDAYLGSRSSNFRQEVRNRERRLRKAHEVNVRVADDATLDTDLDTLFRLHRARWQGRTQFGSSEAFHRDFARVGLAAGWTRLLVLELDGRPAGAWYGFRFAGVDSYFQSGRDPALERQAIGVVLLSHTVRDAFESSQAEYRFLRGDEPYKFRFTDDRDRIETIVTGRGHSLLAAVARAARLSRAQARRLS